MNITIPLARVPGYGVPADNVLDSARTTDCSRTLNTPVSKVSTQEETLFDNVLAEYSTPSTPVDEHFPTGCDKSYLSPPNVRYSTTPRLPPDFWCEESHTSPKSKRGGVALGSPIRFNKYDDCDKIEENGCKKQPSLLKASKSKFAKPKTPESPRRYMTRVEQTLGDEEDECMAEAKPDATKRRNWLSMSFVSKMKRGSKQDSPSDTSRRHSMAQLTSPTLRMPSISSASSTFTSTSEATATSSNTSSSSKHKGVMPSLRKRLSRELRRHSTFGMDDHQAAPPRKYTPDMISLPRVTSMSSFSNTYIPKRPAPPPSPSIGSSPSFRNSMSDVSSLRSTPPAPMVPRHARIRDDIDSGYRNNDKPFFERAEVDEVLRKAVWTKTSDERIDEEEEEDEDKAITPIIEQQDEMVEEEGEEQVITEQKNRSESEVESDNLQIGEVLGNNDDALEEHQYGIDATPQSTHTTTISTDSFTLDESQYLDLDFAGFKEQGTPSLDAVEANPEKHETSFLDVDFQDSKEQETSLISMFDKYLDQL